MTYRTKLDDATAEIEAAREAVAKADAEYSRSGNVDAINRANARLARTHSEWREIYGLNVPDRR